MEVYIHVLNHIYEIFLFDVRIASTMYVYEVGIGYSINVIIYIRKQFINGNYGKTQL